MSSDNKIAAGEFKAKCLKIMDQIHKKNLEMVVTKRGKAMVKIVPVKENLHEEIFGCMKGTAKLLDPENAPQQDNYANDAAEYQETPLIQPQKESQIKEAFPLQEVKQEEEDEQFTPFDFYSQNNKLEEAEQDVFADPASDFVQDEVNEYDQLLQQDMQTANQDEEYHDAQMEAAFAEAPEVPSDDEEVFSDTTAPSIDWQSEAARKHLKNDGTSYQNTPYAVEKTVYDDSGANFSLAKNMTVSGKETDGQNNADSEKLHESAEKPLYKPEYVNKIYEE